jgi:hypothetical protein
VEKVMIQATAIPKTKRLGEVIEALRSIPIPKFSLDVSRANRTKLFGPDSETVLSDYQGFHCKPDDYQIALLTFRGAKDGAGIDSSRNSDTCPVLILPLIWEDFEAQIVCESCDSKVAGKDHHDVVQFGEVQINFLTLEARRSDCPVSLTAMEFKTLKFFVSNPYRVLSRDELLNEVWGYDNYPCTRTVDNRILKLRQKLEKEAASPVHFQTVHGVGYKFIP